MASTGQARPDVAVVADYLRGVAKYLLRELFGPDGLPWGTPLSQLEDLIGFLHTSLAVELLQLALQQQANRFPLAPEEFRLCPGCRSPLANPSFHPRPLNTRKGFVLWNEPVCPCRACRRACFPQSRSLGIDQGSFSTSALRLIIDTAVSAYSYAAAHDSLKRLAELRVLPKQIERLVHRIGGERLAERDAEVEAFRALPLADKFKTPEGVSPPDLAVVMVDGGRLQIRSAADEAEPEESGESDSQQAEGQAGSRGGRHWRENKAGLLMTMHSTPQQEDPCPDLPDCFLECERIGRVARQIRHQAAAAAPGTFQRGEQGTGQEGAEPEPADQQRAEPADRSSYEPPEVGQRKVVASRLRWPEFAVLLAATAWGLGFQGAKRKAFVGDGSQNNWDIHKRFFGSFVAILDFLHALSYVHSAAMAGRQKEEGWQIYRRWISWVWQGQVQGVIQELQQRQQEVGEPEEGQSETSVCVVVNDALRYLRNNASRMDYPRYRKAGLPISSSLMESTVKQINRRVKGSEKFWTEQGAEAILQLRADQISSDEPLEEFWRRREQQASGQRRYAGSTSANRPSGARAPRKRSEQNSTCGT